MNKEIIMTHETDDEFYDIFAVIEKNGIKHYIIQSVNSGDKQVSFFWEALKHIGLLNQKTNDKEIISKYLKGQVEKYER